MIETQKTAELKELVEFVYAKGAEAAKKENANETKKICGETYLFHNGKCEQMEEHDAPTPHPIAIYSLQGLVDYIAADIDGIFGSPERRHIVLVENPYSVKVLSPLRGVKNNLRDTVLTCSFTPSKIPFDSFMPSDDFNIVMMTRFRECENLKLVKTLVANIKNESSVQAADNGYGQQVTVVRGVCTAGDVKVENPVYLTPMRIFPEVDQPRSPFTIRFQDGAQVALFESDGGAWKMQAVENIRNWLDEKLADFNVEVIG